MISRKQRIDTITGAVATVQSAFQDLSPPDTVALGEAVKFWPNIISMKPKSEWTAHNLEIAAFLAKAMYRLDVNSDKIQSEGDLIATDKGALMANPRVAIIHGLHAQIKGWRQTLGIHDRGANGEKRDADKRRSHMVDIEGGFVASQEADDLASLFN